MIFSGLAVYCCQTFYLLSAGWDVVLGTSLHLGILLLGRIQLGGVAISPWGVHPSTKVSSHISAGSTG